MLTNDIVAMCAVRLMLAACLAVAAPMTSGGIALAADGPAEATAAVAQPLPTGNRPDFLFGQPRIMIGLSGGRLQTSPGGLLGSFQEYLTIDDGAYDTLLFRFAGGVSVAPRVDLVFDVEVSQTGTVSEYRFFDEGGQPIRQHTELWQVPVNAGVRYWVLPRGRQIGRLAWVPSKLGVHVGIGGGMRRYRLSQNGDFVDYVDLAIYDDLLRAQGWAASAYVSAGASVRLTRRLFGVVDVRRVWSQSELFGDYDGDIDLNGLQMTGGIELVF